VDWVLGIGDWGLGPIPSPQSPIPNPQFFMLVVCEYLKLFILSKQFNKFYVIKNND